MSTPLGDGSPCRVAVALSGGVDSAVALALLREQGLEVLGLTMRLWRAPSGQGDPAEADLASARRVCERLGVEHIVVDLREAFYEQVVCHLVDEYAAGRTPNPCVRCNRRIKFGLLLEHARALGAGALATGHYARIAHADGRYHLLRARDRRKDQSYFLYTLDQRTLAETLLPLGEWTKERTRAFAQQRGLPVHERPESQDLCFAGDGDYRRLLRELAPERVRPGPIYDRTGAWRGEHRGLAFYTIGQRSGLGIAAERPLYVLALDAERNAVIVGHKEDLGQRALLAREVTTVSGQPLPAGHTVLAQIRYRARPVPARVEPLRSGEAWVWFEQPLRDITPGQSVVFYEGEQVLGGGIIAAAGEPHS